MIVFEKFKNLNKINCIELSNSSRGGCDVPLSIEIDKSLCQAPHTSVAQNEPSELPNHVNMARIEPEQSEPNNFSRLKCFYSNPTGLGNKIADLEIIVAELDPDLMFFCETWFSNESKFIWKNTKGFTVTD